MQSLNKEKLKLKNSLIQDKLGISKNVIVELKNDIFNVLKKYTNFKNESINISVKVLSSNKYLINICTEVDEIF